MPKRVNENAGISQRSDGHYRVRLTHKGKQYESVQRRLSDAKNWRASIKTDLDRCPEGIELIRQNWVARTSGPSGEISKSFNHLTDAIDWLRNTEADMRRGNWTETERSAQTLDSFIEEWRASKVGVGAKTMIGYDGLIKNQILPHLGTVELRALDAPVLRKWITTLLKTTGKPTVHKSGALMRQILKFAVKDNVLPRNTALDIELPKLEQPEKTALTWTELVALADECGDMRTFVLFSGLVGTRIGETLALKVSDFDFKKNQFTVRRSWTLDSHGKPVEGPTKTRKSRPIPIPANILGPLLELTDEMPSSAYVFRGNYGQPLDSHLIRRNVLGPAAKRLGLENVTPHTLRHTCASLLISRKTPITTVSRILGHKTVTLTLNTYGHFYTDDLVECMNDIGTLVIPSTPLAA